MNSREGERWSEEGVAQLEFVHGGSSRERKREKESRECETGRVEASE